MGTSAAESCRCGHEREAHRHHRGGSDCALCGTCPRFRPAHRVRYAVHRVVRTVSGRRSG